MSMTVHLFGIEFEVDYSIESGCRGAREAGSGVQLEPDEGRSVELETIEIDGQDLLEVLADSVVAKIKEEVEMNLGTEEEEAYDG